MGKLILVRVPGRCHEILHISLVASSKDPFNPLPLPLLASTLCELGNSEYYLRRRKIISWKKIFPLLIISLYKKKKKKYTQTIPMQIVTLLLRRSFIHGLSPEGPQEDGMRTGTFWRENSRLEKGNYAWGRGNYVYVCWIETGNYLCRGWKQIWAILWFYQWPAQFLTFPHISK